MPNGNEIDNYFGNSGIKSIGDLEDYGSFNRTGMTFGDEPVYFSGNSYKIGSDLNLSEKEFNKLILPKK